MDDTLKARIENEITSQPVVLFMKGNKDFPQCGFSARVVQILDACDTSFHDINVLEDDAIREGIKEFSEWPTIPQLYVNGNFIGGCDIAMDMYQTGELQELLKKAA